MKHAIFLDLRGRPVVVIGGGAVAERKIESLLDAGARVTVIAPDVTDLIARWTDAQRVRLERRRYLAGDLAGAQLAYAATDDEAANHAVREEASARGVWLNVADQPQSCDFFAPAVVQRGRVAIAISTDGASPALAARLRERLDADLPAGLDRLVDELAELRERCRREGRPLSEVRERVERMIDDVLRK
ncbi:MAG: bifunctional precorrin-2 dehydrogenase/sirohydrochlorin ferrochelatase [Bacteroidales bacterium]